MAAKELLMNVVLGGKTTSGFDALAGKITGLGSLFSEISEYAIDFEKESLETYKNYETYMLEAQGALTAQYKSASELARVMEGLEDNAQQWAETTIFDTRDVAKSISEASHAGWDYEQMILGIPEAMLLAQAGNLDLSTALDYVIKSLNATKTPFENAGEMIDQWTMAANSGATNIGELGEAMLRMGATARFADSNAELFTMLAVLADMGSVGAEAGTLVRNSMIRLIAPTEKASDVMASLGLTYEEAQEIATDDAALKKANALLEQTGFSAYDSTGKLKPFLDIYKELYGSVNDMAEVDKNAVLSAIFPTRTITGALGLLEAAANDYDGLYKQIIDSDGYAARIAEIQTSGLMGTFEELDSKWESFQLRIGETGAPAVTQVADAFGDMLDVVNGWPDEAFSAIVGGVTTIAAAGPGLMIAGGAMKMLSTLGWKGTAFTLLAVGAGALYGYLSKINELNFEANFGKMELDLDELGAHVDSLTTKFNAEEAAVSQWSTALETAQTEYSELATLFAEDMLGAALTGKTLSDDEKSQLFAYGEGIVKSTLEGIQSASDTDMTFLDMLFGDMSTESEKQAFIDSVGWTDDYYQDLYGEAYSIGEQIRQQMTAALQDGSLNEAERQAIQSSVDRLNEIQAEINKQMSEEDYYTQLYKAQSVSWDSIDTYMADNAAKQEAELERLEALYADLWGHQKAAHEYAMEHAASDAERAELEAKWDNWENGEDGEGGFFNKRDAAIADTMAKYGRLNFAAFDALMNDSDHAEAWELLETVLADGISASDINWSAFEKQGKLYDDYVTDLVNLKKAEDQLYELAAKVGDENLLGLIEQIPAVLGSAFEYEDRRHGYEYEGIDLYNEFSTPEQRELERLQIELDDAYTRLAGIDSEIAMREARLNDASKRPWYYEITDGYRRDSNMLYGETASGNLYDQREQLMAEISELQMQKAEIPFDVEGMTEGGIEAGAAGNAGLMEGFGEPLLTASVDEDTINAESFAAGASGQEKLYAGWGHPVLTASVGISGVASGLLAGAGALVKGMGFFAEGGRATEASIFGEAGAEWAIPEEHSIRTAELLDAARAASGFTWGELIGRTGGLNANAKHEPIQLHYAPVINAQDVAGVETALLKDKNRLMTILRELAAEISLRDDAEVYA